MPKTKGKRKGRGKQKTGGVIKKSDVTASAKREIAIIKHKPDTITAALSDFNMTNYQVMYYRLCLAIDSMDVPIFELIRNKHRTLEEIDAHLTRNPLDASMLTSTGALPLHLAAMSGRADVVDLLLNKYGAAAHINHVAQFPEDLSSAELAEDNFDYRVPVTPLMLAVFAGRVEVLNVFAEYKKANPTWEIDLECVDFYPNRQSCLHHAVIYSHRCVEPLLAMGADKYLTLKSESDQIHTPLHNAVKLCDEQVFTHFLFRLPPVENGYLPVYRDHLYTMLPSVRQKFTIKIIYYDLLTMQNALKTGVEATRLAPHDDVTKTHYQSLNLGHYYQELKLVTIYKMLKNSAMYSAFFGLTEHLEALITADASLLYQGVDSDHRWVLLTYALLGHHEDTIALILRHQETISENPERATEFLKRLFMLGQSRAIELAISKLEISPDIVIEKDGSEHPALHFAIKYKFSIEAIEAIVVNLPALNQLSEDDITPLSQAIEAGRLDVVELLLRSGKPLDNEAQYKTSYEVLLEQPASKLNNKIFQTVILNYMHIKALPELRLVHDAAGAGAGAAPVEEMEDSRECLLDSSYTSPSLCALQGDLEAVQMYLDDEDVMVNKRSSHGETILHSAVRSGNAALVEHLLTEITVIEADTRNNAGVTPMQIAILNEDIECIRVLLNYIEIDWVQDAKRGYTSLHLIARTPALHPILNEINSMVCNVDATDGNGETALIYLVKNGCFAAAIQMLKADANASYTDEQGQTAEQYLLNLWPVTSNYTGEQLDLMIEFRRAKAAELKADTEHQRALLAAHRPLEETSSDNTKQVKVLRGVVSAQKAQIQSLIAKLEPLQKALEKELLDELEAPDPKALKALELKVAALNKGMKTQTRTSDKKLAERDAIIKSLEERLEQAVSEQSTLISAHEKFVSRMQSEQKQALEQQSHRLETLASRPTLEAHEALVAENASLLTQVASLQSSLAKSSADLETASHERRRIAQAYQSAPAVELLTSSLHSTVKEAVQSALAAERTETASMLTQKAMTFEAVLKEQRAGAASMVADTTALISVMKPQQDQLQKQITELQIQIQKALGEVGADMRSLGRATHSLTDHLRSTPVASLPMRVMSPPAPRPPVRPAYTGSY